MFERHAHQAAGLNAGPLYDSASLVPVVSPAQPARAYNMLYQLASQLDSMGYTPVILDASASEGPEGHRSAGRPLGLIHALSSSSMARIERPVQGEWLVMPAAQGLRSLQVTARAGGARVAVSRLLAPFGRQTVVLLFASAQDIASLLGGVDNPVMVPVLAHPQAGIDAYAAFKHLHQSGLRPVLAPLADAQLSAQASTVNQVVRSVADCAGRHLGVRAEIWPVRRWGELACEGAITRTLSYDMDNLHDSGNIGNITHAEVGTYWS